MCKQLNPGSFSQPGFEAIAIQLKSSLHAISTHTHILTDHKKTWKDLKTLGSGQSASKTNATTCIPILCYTLYIQVFLLLNNLLLPNSLSSLHDKQLQVSIHN